MKEGGGFSCEWSDIHSMMLSYGYRYDEPEIHQEMGNITVNFECDYQDIVPSYGGTFIGIHGWTVEHRIEYYILESWDSFDTPEFIRFKDTITVDGGQYDIYESAESNLEMGYYRRYWSVRREKRKEGTVSISQQFELWEALGIKLGKVCEISFLIDGFHGSGSADLKKININIDKNYSLIGDVNEDGFVNSLDYAVLRKYLLGKIDTISSNADINRDGNVDSLDFALLRKHLVGKIFLGFTTAAS